MSYIILFLGVYLILIGVLLKTKKWLWLHLGIRKRTLDVPKFINSAYKLDVVFGLLLIVLGVIGMIFNIHQTVYISALVLLWFIQIPIAIYIENKFSI